LRVAYATAERCGAGHAVRGIALVRAGRRAGIEVRAFGPPVPYPAIMAAGYEGTTDWQEQVVKYTPDLLLGDLHWLALDHLVQRLSCPAWLLARAFRCHWLEDHGPFRITHWERRIGIEPLAELGITDRIPPIVVANPDEVPAVSLFDGQDVTLRSLADADAPFPVAPLLTRARSIVASAGYNAYWESVWLGYRDRVRWITAQRERANRVEIGGEMDENGADVLMRMIRGPV